MKKILLIIILLFIIAIILILGMTQSKTKNTNITELQDSHIITLNAITKNVIEENNYNSEFDINNVRVSIKENSLNENGLILLIENNNSSGFYYYSNFELERYIDNEWQYFVMGHQSTYDEDEIYVDQNSSVEIDILFKNSYLNENKEKIETLEDGKYRINTTVFNSMVSQRKTESLEFEI